jgi:hypothetical protein
MPPEKHGDSVLSELSLGDGQDGLEESFVRYVYLNPIEGQENQSCHDPHPLVSIHEGMVLNNVEEVGGCHFEKIGMQILSTMRSLRHANGGLQQAHVADPGMASVPLDLVSMDFDHLIQA